MKKLRLFDTETGKASFKILFDFYNYVNTLLPINHGERMTEVYGSGR
ncbi:hypothetical protein [Anaerocolumna jejuensis]|nr:hypothetical protein [Anaerocolumna jejuensis]